MRKVLSLAVSAVVLLMLAASQMACSDKDNNITGGPVTNEKDTAATLIAVGTVAADYSAGNFEIISVGDSVAVEKNLIPDLHTDIVVRAYSGDVYILERMGSDKVIKYSNGAVVYDEPLGTGLNVQDIAVVSAAKAYISSYSGSDLIVFNPTTGSKVSTIDLSRYNTYAGTDSAETSPFASALAVYNDYVYVACQRLKTVQSDWGASFVPADTSLIVVIDTRADTVLTSIKLRKKNPAAMDVFQRRLLVSSPGDWYDAATGGVEQIDLTSNTNQGVKVEGSAFGGSVTALVSVSLDKVFIGRMGADRNTEIVPFNTAAGTVGQKIAGIVDGFGGLAYDGYKLYVGERGGAANGVLVVNSATNAVERTISTSLPPSSIAIIFGD
jgi:hypothetical protein